MAASAARAVTPVPALRAPLVGREAEVVAVVDLLQRDGIRLVTLTGAGGVGKTAVAEEAARRYATQVPAIVEKLVVQDARGAIGVEAVKAVVSGTELPASATRARRLTRGRLLVVDGVDAQPGINAAISAALDDDPDLIVLATSITHLQLRGEHVVRLEPLPAPQRGERDPQRATAAPAFRLFCERLAAASPGFDVTAERTETISELCWLLDGLPLALELAAARCVTMPLEVVLERLRRDSVLALLTAPSAEQARHRSLRDTIAWTYELLEPSQREAFEGLGVFTGPFAVDALVAVTDDKAAPASEVDASVLADVYELVAVGLVHVANSDGPAAVDRFTVPAAIREFALDLAAESGRLYDLLGRHADYYFALAQDVAAQLWDFGGIDASQVLIAAKENLISALDVYVARRDPRDTLAFATALTPMWVGTGATAVGARLLESIVDAQAIAAGDALDACDPLAIEAVVAATDLAAWSRDPQHSDPLRRLDDAIEAARRSERFHLLLLTLHAKAELLVADGAHHAARTIADEGVQLASEHAQDFWRMRMLHWRAIAANNIGDYAEALRDAIAARDLAREYRDEHQLLIITHVLTNIRGAYDDPSARVPSGEDLVALALRLGDTKTEGMVRVGVAIRAAMAGDVAIAGDQIAATLALARRTDLWYLEDLSLFTLVFVGVLAGEVEDSVRLHGAVHEAQAPLRVRLTPGSLAVYDAAIAKAEASLGEAAFRQLTEGGRLLRWPEVVLLGEHIAAAVTAQQARANNGLATMPAADRPAGLSARETEVLRLLASGCSNKEIATAMRLRTKTVMHHTSNIYRKLGVRGRTEAVALAWQRGLLKVPETDTRSDSA